MRKYVKKVILVSIIIMLFSIVNINIVYAEDKGDKIYTGIDNSSSNSSASLDDIIKDAEKFENLDTSNSTSVGIGNQTTSIFEMDTTKLRDFSNRIYTAFVILGTGICVAVGLIIGIKFVFGGIEGQAETKKLLKPYLIGCAVVFGAAGIWALVIEILSNI